MSKTPMVTREEWTKARLDLLAEEKSMSKKLDALARKRRKLPWVSIDKNYEFEGPNGVESMSDLFAGRRQLVVYHFMYGPDWKQGCPSCSFWADNYNGIDTHLAHRDTTLIAISNTALENIDAYRKRMGWQFKWVSSLGSEFNRDFNVSFKPEEIEAGEVQYNFTMTKFPVSEAPGLSVFVRTDNGGIAHSYSCHGRGLDIFNGAYQMLDMTPMGRDEDDLTHKMAWVRRHDQYEDQ